MLVRAEALRLDGQGDSAICGKVHTVERLGGDTYLYLSALEGADITVHAAGDHVVSSGDQVTIGLNAEKCHLFHHDGEAFERLPA